MSRSSTRSGAIPRALLALTVLAGLSLAAPTSLWRTLGWPLPRSLPTWESLNGPVSDAVLIKGLAVMCWVAWAQLMVCLVAEIIAYARGRRALRLPGSATMQRLASWLVTSILVVGSSPLLRGGSIATRTIPLVQRASAVALVAHGPQSEVVPARDPVRRSYTVERRDTLWGIATRYLGDPLRWREILELNQGQVQVDGGALGDPRQLRRGWNLLMPDDAVGLTVGSDESATTMVVPGDSLSELAERHLGDDQRWPGIFELNRRQPQPGGGSLENPDLIRPDWALRLPGSLATVTAVSSVPSAVPPPADPGLAPLSPSIDRAPPTTASPFEAPAPSNSAPASVGSPEAGDRAPAPPLGLLGAGLVAGGVVLALDRLRRARARHRLPGQPPLCPSPAHADAERSLRASAEERRADIDRLDVALRGFGAGLRQRSGTVPSILALQFGNDGLELLLSKPASDPPAGFAAQDDGWAWSIPTDAIDGLGPGVESLAPLPAVVTVGPGEAGTILVDLETAGSIEILGDGVEARRLLAGFALELATSSWADHLELVLVGAELPSLPALERVSRVATTAAVIDRLEQSATAVAEQLTAAGFPSTLAARTVPGTTDAWSPTVVLCSAAPDDPELTARLVALSGNGGQGVAVVVVGPVPDARWCLTCEGGDVTVAPLGLRVRSAAPPNQDLAVVEALLEDPVPDGNPSRQNPSQRHPRRPWLPPMST